MVAVRTPGTKDTPRCWPPQSLSYRHEDVTRGRPQLPEGVSTRALHGSEVPSRPSLPATLGVIGVTSWAPSSATAWVPRAGRSWPTAGHPQPCPDRCPSLQQLKTREGSEFLIQHDSEQIITAWQKAIADSIGRLVSGHPPRATPHPATLGTGTGVSHCPFPRAPTSLARRMPKAGLNSAPGRSWGAARRRGQVSSEPSTGQGGAATSGGAQLPRGGGTCQEHCGTHGTMLTSGRSPPASGQTAGGASGDSDSSKVRNKLRKFLQRRPTLQSLRERGYIKGGCSGGLRLGWVLSWGVPRLEGGWGQ